MSELADQIVADILARSPFEPREDGIDGLARAYEIQNEVTQALLQRRPGRRIAGYKIAFNRQSSMDYYHLSEPCYAPLFSDQLYPTGAKLASADFADLVIEPEIALQLKTPIPVNATLDDMAAAVVALPAIEIMDVRGAFARDPSAAAAIAQRIHSEGAVLGASVPFDGLNQTTARILRNGALDGEASNAAPQPPLVALAWLANRLRRDSLPLEPGMVVLTGAHLPGRAIAGPGTVAVDIEPLGSVRFELV